MCIRDRSKDAYSPGGKMGKRPDRAVIVYCKKIREAYNNIPIICLLYTSFYFIGHMRHSCKRLKRRKVYFNKFVVYRIAVGRKLCPIDVYKRQL